VTEGVSCPVTLEEAEVDHAVQLAVRALT
jgi:hypothetical protein